MYLHFALIRKKERTTTARNKGYTWILILESVLGTANNLVTFLKAGRYAGSWFWSIYLVAKVGIQVNT